MTTSLVGGMVFLKEAPLPAARPARQAADLCLRGGDLRFPGLGAGSAAARQSYRLTTMVFPGGDDGATEALVRHQRGFRLYEAGRDEMIWHCVWGERNRDGRICEEFLERELEVISELGTGRLYFSDGWQKGVSFNSVVGGGVWEGQRRQEDYWTPNPARFPRGLDGIAAKAKALGLKTALSKNACRTHYIVTSN